MKFNSIFTKMAAALLAAGMMSAVTAQDIETDTPDDSGPRAFGRGPGAGGPGMRGIGQQVREMAPGRRGGGPGRRGPNPEREFDRLDANADGVVDENEFVAARTDRVSADFERRDSDDDGLLSREELERHPRGERPGIDREEVIACVRETIADYDPEAELDDRFDTIDTNDDSFIDQLELSTALQARAYALFDRLDSDNDGLLTLEELEAGHAAALNVRRVIHACIEELSFPLDTDADV